MESGIKVVADDSDVDSSVALVSVSTDVGMELCSIVVVDIDSADVDIVVGCSDTSVTENKVVDETTSLLGSPVVDISGTWPDVVDGIVVETSAVLDETVVSVVSCCSSV